MEVDRSTALKALFNLSVDANLEFIKERTEKGPLFYFMVMARRGAVEALQAMVRCDPSKTEDMRKLQNEVERFIETVEFVRNIFREGDEAAKQLSAEEEEEAREIIAAEGGEIPGADA